MAPKQNGGSNHGNVLVFTQQQYHWETHNNVYKHLESNIMGQNRMVAPINVLAFTQQQHHWETCNNVYKHLESNIMGLR